MPVPIPMPMPSTIPRLCRPSYYFNPILQLTYVTTLCICISISIPIPIRIRIHSHLYIYLSTIDSALVLATIKNCQSAISSFGNSPSDHWLRMRGLLSTSQYSPPPLCNLSRRLGQGQLPIFRVFDNLSCQHCITEHHEQGFGSQEAF